MPKKTKPKTPKTPNPLPYDGYLTDPANPSDEPQWATAQHYATRNYTIDSLSTVLDAATQAILTQRADVMPQAVKVAQAALARLLEALQVDPKAKEGAK